MKKLSFMIGTIVLLGALNIVGWGQSSQATQASDVERELVRRELEYRLTNERGRNITVRIERAQSSYLSNRENRVWGRAVVTRRNYNDEWIRFNAVVDTRNRRVADLEWRAVSQGDRDDYYDPNPTYPGRPDTNRPPSGPLQTGIYEIQLVATRRMLAVGPGNTVVQTAQRNDRSQRWLIEDAGNGFYYLVSVATREVMTISGSGDRGSTIVLAPRQWNSDAQLWEVRTGPDNGYYFITRRGKSMDSPSSARFDGGRMQVYDRNGEANQRFWLKLVQAGGRFDDDYQRPIERPRERPRDRDLPQTGGGRMTWSGRVDDVVELVIRDNSVREVNVAGQPVYNSRYRFDSRMPNRDFNADVRRLRGRGEVEIVQQPSPGNRYSLVIRIRDRQRGADDYEIEVLW